MLIHHSSSTNHPLFFATSKVSYNVKSIRESLSEEQRKYLLFCHAFTGCDTISAIAGHGKTTLFDKLCAADIDKHIDVFLDVQASKDAVIRNGTAIFQYIYHAPGTSLATIRYNMFLRKAAAGVIKPEILPPTEGTAAQYSLCAYLQTWDWRSCWNSLAVIVEEIVAIDGAAVGRTMSNASPRMETAKALRAKIALMTKSLEKTQTSIHEAG